MSPARAAREVENAITGEKRVIPAYVPKRRATPSIPKENPSTQEEPQTQKHADPGRVRPSTQPLGNSEPK